MIKVSDHVIFTSTLPVWGFHFATLSVNRNIAQLLRFYYVVFKPGKRNKNFVFTLNPLTINQISQKEPNKTKNPKMNKTVVHFKNTVQKA